MDLKGKIILVVGGATGIGRATAELCNLRGAEVLVADITPADGWQGAFYKVDVTDETSVKQLFTEIDRRHGHLDSLVQTAGILKGAFTPLSELDVATFKQVLDVNVTGSFLCAKHAEPLLKKSSAGVVVLLSSGAATGGSSSLAYGSSKGAVNSLAITLTNRLAPHNIRVNIVSPGNIDTPMKRSVIEADAKRQGAQMDKLVSESHLGMPEGVAKLIAFLVSDDADYVRGLINTR